MIALQEYLRYLVTLTAVLDPFLAIPIFVGVTAARDEAATRRLANVVTITVFLVLAGAALFGESLLKVLGASLPAFRVGGGLVLLLMALAMLNAKVGEMRQTRAEAAELESREVSGVVPLAVPLLAGPGAISTTIIAAQTGGVAHLLALLVCIALVSALLWGMLRIAHAVGERMGTTGLNVATRLLGLILAAIAIETMADGLKELFPGLAS
ncbi:MAG: NAAT family transporter [Betaproteobacteria bacterium]|nr:MAG: NAAT family transporter [Betaproteobacteria bacterium]